MDDTREKPALCGWCDGHGWCACDACSEPDEHEHPCVIDGVEYEPHPCWRCKQQWPS